MTNQDLIREDGKAFWVKTAGVWHVVQKSELLGICCENGAYILPTPAMVLLCGRNLKRLEAGALAAINHLRLNRRKMCKLCRWSLLDGHSLKDYRLRGDLRDEGNP